MKRRLAEALCRGLAVTFDRLAEALHEPKSRQKTAKPGWYERVEATPKGD